MSLSSADIPIRVISISISGVEIEGEEENLEILERSMSISCKRCSMSILAMEG